MAPNFKDLGELRGAFTWTMLLVFVMMNISVFSFGFDNSVFSSIQAMTPYQKMFGGYDEKNKKWGFSTQHLAFLNSLGLPAKGLGTAVGYLIGENFGRKPCFISMQFVALAGVAVTYSAKTYAQALAGRIIIQCFVGWEDWLVPMFLAELAPASVRGATVLVYVFAHFFGSLICSFVTLGTSRLDDNRSWQIPVGLMFIFPSVSLLLSYFLPESPRYLIRRNKYDAAVASLKYLYRGEETFSAENEAALLRSSIEGDSSTKGTWLDLVKGTNLRRTHVAVATAAFNQLTGQSFSSQYGTIFVKSLKVFDPFVFGTINRVVLMLGPIVGIAIIDSVGRRPIYLVGGIGAAISMMSIGGLGTGNVTVSDKKGIIACVILFGPFYSGAFGSIGAVTGAEAPHLRLRDKTTFLVYITHIVCDFAVSYSLPYLMHAGYANLQSKVGFIYGSIALLAVVWAYFYLPEMRKRSLEELEDMWQAKVPARKFRSWKAPEGSVGAIVTMNESSKARHEEAMAAANKQQVEHLETV